MHQYINSSKGAMAEELKGISVAEFFEKNRHLLGFDNPVRALLTTVKEFVDNSLDSAEKHKILPEIFVQIQKVSDTRFKVIVEDNGGGIPKEHVANAFGKLLYGSKFQTFGGMQSLTWDEPVLILQNNKAELKPIGELVDSLLKRDEEVRDVTNLNIFVPAFDAKTKRYSLRRVSHVIRHKRENECLKIKLETNREIKVTGCHSLFVLDPETLEVKPVEARTLKIGDYLISPKSLPRLGEIRSINVLDYISLEDVKKNHIYVYGFSKQFIEKLFSKAKLVRKHVGKVRKFYRFKSDSGEIDIVEERAKQYAEKGFLPLSLVLALKLQNEAAECYLQTYRHGIITKFPVVLELTEDFARFLGLYVAEGHCDKRQIGFTFGKHEDHLVKFVTDIATRLGLSSKIELRERSIRVKVFGTPISILFPKWCGRGAHKKRVPEFMFRAKEPLQRAFLSGIIEGDGHKRGNLSYISTTSKMLANELSYLALMLGIVVSITKRKGCGLGKKPYLCYNLLFSRGPKSKVYERLPLFLLKPFVVVDGSYKERFGYELSKVLGLLGICSHDKSACQKYVDALLKADFKERGVVQKLRDLGYLTESNGQLVITEKLLKLREKIAQLERFASSDLCLLKIKSIEKVQSPSKYVYDLSIPGHENFVGGFGGLACHNSRGQQGIGASAAILYAQLTTGKPARIISKTKKDKLANVLELKIDVKSNSPEIITQTELDWQKEHGVRVEVELEAKYAEKKASVIEYLKETAIVNPHATIIYIDPDGQKHEFIRVTEVLPKEPIEIKPHPHGVELGLLLRMLKETSSRTLKSFLTGEFDRVGDGTAEEILKTAGLDPKIAPRFLSLEQADKLIKAMHGAKVMSPTTTCLVPIGAELIKKSLEAEYNAEFVHAVTRPASVYRGNPFLIEAAILLSPDLPADQPVKLFRFANRVPLLYQQGACALTEAVMSVDWKNYGLQQSGKALPVGPAIILLHMASVWAPFTSESKEAIAHYPEIIKEAKLALQEVGRALQLYLSKKRKTQAAKQRVDLFKSISEELATALANITDKPKEELISKITAAVSELASTIKEEPEEVAEEEKAPIKKRKIGAFRIEEGEENE
jgi:DNA topoisomerase-6 subunit B